MQMKNVWLHLPTDILHHILEYDDSIVFRNGKYMNRISKDDVRYSLLKSIPMPVVETWSKMICVDVFFRSCIERRIVFRQTKEVYSSESTISSPSLELGVFTFDYPTSIVNYTNLGTIMYRFYKYKFSSMIHKMYVIDDDSDDGW